ncbi:MAG: nitroreductase family deazaflavin-dependent oxidoreductase [Thermomicrobiales bacterium]
MPIPRAIAKVNRDGLNRITHHFAGRIPPFILISHTGRRSGKPYTVPLLAFRDGDRYIIALTYGETTDWQRNIEAGGPASLTTHGVTLPIGAFQTVDRNTVRHAIPRPIHCVLDMLGADRVAVVEVGNPPN